MMEYMDSLGMRGGYFCFVIFLLFLMLVCLCGCEKRNPMYDDINVDDYVTITMNEVYRYPENYSGMKIRMHGVHKSGKTISILNKDIWLIEKEDCSIVNDPIGRSNETVPQFDVIAYGTIYCGNDMSFARPEDYRCEIVTDKIVYRHELVPII